MNTENPAMLQDDKVVVYETPDGEMRVDVRLDRETVWLTQRQMAELFGRDRSVVTKHIRNIFKEGELEPEATCAKFAQVQSEGGRAVSRKVEHFNLDVIISVGYRVNSKRGVQFRQWATRTLRDHLVRGYTLHKQRLAERGLREARETLDLLAQTFRNQALVDNTGQATPTPGACSWSTTRIDWRRRPVRSHPSAYWIMTAPPRRLRNSSRN